jgi:hypothetical protein
MSAELGKLERRKMQRQQPEVKLQPLHNPCQSKVSCNICNWWKKEGSETKKYKISLCTISCHKTAKQGQDNGGRRVSPSDFQNTRPLPFASAAEPMDAVDWLRDTERKLDAVGYNDTEKLWYTSYMLIGLATCFFYMETVRQKPHSKLFKREHIVQHIYKEG